MENMKDLDMKKGPGAMPVIPPVELNFDIKNTEADIVVVGGGAAGLAAGAKAAEMGAKVIVLESNAVPGGSAMMAGGIWAAASPVQEREGINIPKDRSILIANQHSHHRADPYIVKAYVEGSAQMIEWLEGQGMHFIPFKDESESFGGFPAGGFHLPIGAGVGLTRHMTGVCVKNGGQVWPKCRAKDLVMADGKISGVAFEHEGVDYTIKTKKVILSGGGFGGNKDICRERCLDFKDNMTCYGMQTEGIGLHMAKETAADIEKNSALLLVGPTQPKSISIKIDTGAPKPAVMQFSTLLTEPNTVWVNKRGKRFCNEFIGANHFESANAVVVQPDNEMWAVFDASTIEYWENEGFFVGFGAPLMVNGKKLPGLEKAIMANEDKGIIKKANSLEELAALMGVPWTALQKTIADYNECCSSKKDIYLGKAEKYLFPIENGPFYAAKGRTDFLNTFGGIRINEKMQVVDANENPVEGLYAAGADASGWVVSFYNGYIPGNAFGFSVFSGMTAGKEAATGCK